MGESTGHYGAPAELTVDLLGGQVHHPVLPAESLLHRSRPKTKVPDAASHADNDAATSL